jgi:hypothetical protein
MRPSLKRPGWLELARERAACAELAAQTGRLSALQSQMQPHFIFNSLNAISTLVGDGRNPEARAALSLLGDFLRKTMTMRDQQRHPAWAGVNNVLDKDPPVVSANVVASGAANSFPTYDQLGRQLYLAFTAKF